MNKNTYIYVLKMPIIMRMRGLRTRSIIHNAMPIRNNRWRHQLAEFLQKKYAQRQAINAEEETSSSSQDLSTHLKIHQVTTIPDDLLFKIFILLPAESLLRLQIVCKQWYNLINSNIFIRFHAQQSHTVLISPRLTLIEPSFYAVLNPGLLPQQFVHKLRSYFHLLDLDNGNDHSFIESSVVELVDVCASYDGLILATMVNRNKRLIFMNPLTRKHIVLPLGTAIANYFHESYGIVFCDEAKTYKVVHLFSDAPWKSGCEILSICTRKWRRIKGLTSEFSRFIPQNLVSVCGSLYWLPEKHNCDRFVSLNVHDEKFIVKKLPVISGLKDRLIEIGGSLGFVAQVEEVDELQVWILINDGGSEVNWERHYNFSLSVDFMSCTPICSSRNGKEMVFGNQINHLYAYNFDRNEMRQLYSRDDDDDDDELFERVEMIHIPHRNTLVSWEGSS